MTDGDSIAIVGCAYRLPGGIRSDADFWRLLPGDVDDLLGKPRVLADLEGFSRCGLMSAACQTAVPAIG